MTRRLVVLRFDRNPLVCRERVALLRRFNPQVPIAGLYGGAWGWRGAAFRGLGEPVIGLDSLFFSPHPGRWNWQHGDLALAAWFRDVGHRFDFDVVHFVEWDLLLVASLGELYGHVPENAVGLTAYTPLSDISEDWDWANRPHLSEGTNALFAAARQKWGYQGVPFACFGVGPCLPRQFLEDFVAAQPPEFGHDELRLPLFAQLLGYEVVDTGFRSSWRSIADDRLFNASGIPIDHVCIEEELRRPDGRRAFHPVHGRVSSVFPALVN
jgi:hypothetical protein